MTENDGYLHSFETLNAAARVLTRTRNYDHISPVLSTLHWLPIKHNLDFKILLTTYKALNGLVPQYKSEVLSHYSPSRPLRSQNSGCLIMPRITKPTAGGRSFFYLAPKRWNNLTNTVLLLWHSTEAVAFFSPRPPLFSLLALQYCLIYWETLSALFFKLRNYGFDQLVSQRYWHHLLDKKLGFRGTCLPGRNVRSWLHDGRVGEVANRVSSGSFRGGHWRYLPIWNHDNRYFADWIRLCPGLSKNSIWILSWRSSRLCKRKLMIFEIRMDKESSRGIGMRLLAPSLNNRNLIFFGSPVLALTWQGRCWKFIPGKEHCSETLLPLASVALNPPAWQAGLWPAPEKWQRVRMAAWWSWITSPVASRVSMVYVLLFVFDVFSCSHTVLPKELLWGLFFFSSLSSCYAVFFFNSTCISLLIILVWLCMWRIIKNLEPWEADTLCQFKSRLKTHLFNLAYT